MNDYHYLFRTSNNLLDLLQAFSDLFEPSVVCMDTYDSSRDLHIPTWSGKSKEEAQEKLRQVENPLGAKMVHADHFDTRWVFNIPSQNRRKQMHPDVALYQSDGTLKQVNGPGEIFINNEHTKGGSWEILLQDDEGEGVLGTFRSIEVAQAAFERVSSFGHPLTLTEIKKLFFGNIKEWEEIREHYKGWTTNCIDCGRPVSCTPYYDGSVWCLHCYNEQLNGEYA